MKAAHGKPPAETSISCGVCTLPERDLARLLTRPVETIMGLLVSTSARRAARVERSAEREERRLCSDASGRGRGTDDAGVEVG